MIHFDAERKSFSIFGIVNSAKRNRLKGNAVAAQVFVYNQVAAKDVCDVLAKEVYNKVIDCLVTAI